MELIISTLVWWSLWFAWWWWWVVASPCSSAVTTSTVTTPIPPSRPPIKEGSSRAVPERLRVAKLLEYTTSKRRIVRCATTRHLANGPLTVPSTGCGGAKNEVLSMSSIRSVEGSLDRAARNARGQVYETARERRSADTTASSRDNGFRCRSNTWVSPTAIGTHIQCRQKRSYDRHKKNTNHDDANPTVMRSKVFLDSLDTPQ